MQPTQYPTRRTMLRTLAGLSVTSSFAACGGSGSDGGSANTSDALDTALAQPILTDSSTSPANGVFFGIFREAALNDFVPAAASELRRRPAAAMWFTRFESAFPTSQIQYLHEQNIVAQVTWEPWKNDNSAITLASINAGTWDAYIDAWGAAAAAQNIPFMLRWGHEFNGDWYPWSLKSNGANAAAATAYIAAFRRIVLRLRAAGATRIQHVWCYNNSNTPAAAWNDPRTAYPGDDVVDWIGIDGYNFGTSQSWSRWTSFNDVFSSAVSMAGQIAPAKPIILAEMGCSETGGNKAAWIRQMATDLKNMPSVRALTWFDTQKETSWQLTSSEASWLAGIELLHQPLFRGNAEALIAVAARP